MAEAQQAPMHDLSNGPGSVSYRPPRQNREVEVITIHEPRQRPDESLHRPNEPSHRSRLSQRILPSIEMDDSDVKDRGFIRDEAIHQYDDMPLRENAARGGLRYGPRSTVETRTQADVADLRQGRDEADVYFISERPRAPASYEGYGRSMVAIPGEHAIAQNIRQRGMESIYNKEPHVVDYGSRIVHLPPRAQEQIAKPRSQSQSSFQLIHERAGRPFDFSHGPSSVPSFENRPPLHMQVVQPLSTPQSHPVFNVPSYPSEHRHAPGLHPAVVHDVRTQSASDASALRHREGSSRNVQYHDDLGRALPHGPTPRREAFAYVSPTRAMG